MNETYAAAATPHTRRDVPSCARWTTIPSPRQARRICRRWPLESIGRIWRGSQRTTRAAACCEQLRVVRKSPSVHRSAADDPVLTRGPARKSTAIRTASRRRPRPAASPPSGSGGIFVLRRKIGEGAFGEVYHAHDTWLDHPRRAEAAQAATSPIARSRQRILLEARRLARVRHPNVVTVHGADIHDGRVGFWMELVDGDTLERRSSRSGPLSAGEAALHRPGAVPGARRRAPRRPHPSRRQGAERHARRRRRPHRPDGLRRRASSWATPAAAPVARHAAVPRAGALARAAPPSSRRHLRRRRAPVSPGHRPVPGDGCLGAPR